MSVILYTKSDCPYCHKAKALLREKGAAFVEHDLCRHPSLREEMVTKSGGRTSVPQIFISGRHIGGCDDLHALDAKGALDALLQEA
jgi:glutaredoxin 3